MSAPSAPQPRHTALLSTLVLAAGLLAGCRADYSADIRNLTPQPIFAQLTENRRDGTVIVATRRLGPGDRALVGPVRAESGRVALLIDTKPNPEAPARRDLQPGQNAFNVRQRTDEVSGPLEIEDLTDPR